MYPRARTHGGSYQNILSADTSLRAVTSQTDTSTETTVTPADDRPSAAGQKVQKQTARTDQSLTLTLTHAQEVFTAV